MTTGRVESGHLAENPRAPRATTREWVGLAVLALPTLLVSIDIGALYLALPSLTTDLGATAVQQLWVTDIYGFVLAGLSVTMGTLGDRIGRRRLLLTGAGLFATTSTIAAYSSDPGMLIAARAGMGVAAATLMPSTLSLIRALFRDNGQRRRAISIWVSTMMLGSAVGPVVGAALLELFWWGAVFLLAVPVGAVLLVVGPRCLPEVRHSDPPPHDWLGAALSAVGLLPLVYGLKVLALTGSHSHGLVGILGGLAVLLVFVRRQQRVGHPLLDLRLFTDPALTTALCSMLVVAASMAGTFLVMSQFVQTVLGMPPVETGLGLLPMGVGVAVGAQLAPRLADRWGSRTTIVAGLLLSVSGFWLIAAGALLGTDGPVAAFVGTGGILMHLGAGPLFALGAGIVVSSAPPERAGGAAALAETSNNLGATLGLALLGTAASAAFTRGISGSSAVDASGLPESATGTVASTVEAARGLPPGSSGAVVEAAESAFATALTTVSAAGGLAVLLAAAAVARQLRTVEQT